jgi:enoyl-CoA hydratase/carnithine racemase
LSDDVVIAHRDDQLWVTLANGDDGNYLKVSDIARLTEELVSADRAGKRYAVISSQGEDFCLGRAPGKLGSAEREILFGLVECLQNLRLVTIAAASGGCAGFGVGLFALADISIASESAWFQFPEIAGGSAPSIVATWLFDLVPPKVGLRWLLTGTRIGAHEAVGAGLVSTLVADADLRPSVTAEAATIASLAPQALSDVKSVARTMRSLPADLASRRAVALKWFPQPKA